MSIRSTALALVLAILITLGGGGVGLAQDLDAKWVAGKWDGTSQSVTGGGARLEVTFNEDGGFAVCAQMPGRFACGDGRWRIEGGAIMMEYRLQDRRRQDPNTWTLSRDGEGLQGRGINHVDSSQYTLTLKRSR